MKHSLGTLSEPARAYVLAVILCGAAVCVYSTADLLRNPVSSQWLILLALTVGSGWATLRIPQMPISFSISDTFNIAAALLFGPSAGAISAAVDGLVLSSRMASTRRSPDRVLFNMAAPAIAIWVAAEIFVTLGGSRPLVEGPVAAIRLLALLTLFGAVDFGLNSGIVAMAVSFERRVSMLAIWREHLAGVWITYFGGIFGAMLLMVLTRSRTLDILILIIPLPVILYVTFRHAVGRAQDQITHLGSVNRVYVAAIEALAHAVDVKDQVTHDHTRRVQDETLRLARALAVEDEGELHAIRAAALLHDVGKLAVPEHILNKPGRLTPAELQIMKRHAPIGADILSVIGFPYAVAPIVRHHHENWDGTGYPDGLAGDQIPIGSRIIAVVDCFDALTSDRPYRPRMEDREALQILSNRRGNMYDPHVVDAFFALHGKEVPASLPHTTPRPASPHHPLELIDDRREDADLQTFFNFGRALTYEFASTAQLGEAVWTHFGPRLPASSFVYYAYDEANDSIAAVYTAGGETSHAGTIALGDRLSGWVAATGQSVMNSDARLDLDEPARGQSILRSALAVAVVSSGRPAGVLTFYAPVPDAFDQAHRRLIEAASRALAGIIAARTAVSLGRASADGARIGAPVARTSPRG